MVTVALPAASRNNISSQRSGSLFSPSTTSSVCKQTGATLQVPMNAKSFKSSRDPPHNFRGCASGPSRGSQTPQYFDPSTSARAGIFMPCIPVYFGHSGSFQPSRIVWSANVYTSTPSGRVVAAMSPSFPSQPQAERSPEEVHG